MAMSMTNQQKGLIGEWEVAKLLMIGGRGALVVTIPMAIDAGHDLKVYERGRPSGGLALQVKVTTRLPRRSGHPFLQASFRAPLRPFVASPRLWFLFGHID